MLKTPGFGPISLKGFMPMQSTRSLLLLTLILAAVSGASGQSISGQNASAGSLRARAEGPSPRSIGKTKKRSQKLATGCPDIGRCFPPQVNALPSRPGARVGRGNPRAANRHDPDAASGVCLTRLNSLSAVSGGNSKRSIQQRKTVSPIPLHSQSALRSRLDCLRMTVP